MNRKISIGGAITLAIMFSTVTFIITMIYSVGTFNSSVFNIKEREKMFSKLAEVNSLVQQNYFNEIDDQLLGDEMVRGYVKGLGDRYGMYMTAEQYNETIRDYEGRMVDIGVAVSQDPGGYIKIEEVYSDSPAATADLQKGDLIVKVDELDVTAENYVQAVEALKGEPGTQITILVRRGGEEKEYELTRRKVEVPTADYKIFDDVGYVTIKAFNDNTPDQFNRVIDALLAQNVQAIVFDVRGNPGGTIDSVCKMLDRLLPEGVIATATYRDGSTEVLGTSDANEVNLPMVVLINGKSASASELFAQALKDYGKAKTVGVNSYGKGSMQKIYKLSDGSALDITVAHFNPPKSPNFEGVGVKADYEVKMTTDPERDIASLREDSDPQLKKAVEVARAAVKNQEIPMSPDLFPESSSGADSDGFVEAEVADDTETGSQAEDTGSSEETSGSQGDASQAE